MKIGGIKARGRLEKDVFLDLVNRGFDEVSIRKAEQNLRMMMIPGKNGVFDLAWAMELPLKGEMRCVAFCPECFEWVESDDPVNQDGMEDEE